MLRELIIYWVVDMIELKQCPFCSGVNHSLECDDKRLMCDTVECNGCGALVPCDEWNTRADEWISVEDRLPEVGIKVLCYRPEAEKSGDEIIKVSYALDGKNRSPQGIEHKFECWCHVTHWMPLPNPPKADKQ